MSLDLRGYKEARSLIFPYAGQHRAIPFQNYLQDSGNWKVDSLFKVVTSKYCCLSLNYISHKTQGYYGRKYIADVAYLLASVVISIVCTYALH